MPVGVVKTDRDEHLWEKAKTQARKKKPAPDDFYAYVMGIYQQMKGEKAMPVILIKAHVKAHTRRTATGRVVSVRGHEAGRRTGVREWRHAHGGKIYLSTDLNLSGRGITQTGKGKGHARGLKTYLVTHAAFREVQHQHGKFKYQGTDSLPATPPAHDPEENKRMMEVAQTIKQQIGGQAAYMLGAKDWGAGKDKQGDYYLQFRIGRNDKGVNVVKITLNAAMDTYDVEYWRIRGTKFTMQSSETDIYADQLHESIERNTGMYISMGTMGGEMKKFKKSRVRAHTRRMKSGKVVTVREHTDKRLKKIPAKTQITGTVQHEGKGYGYLVKLVTKPDIMRGDLHHEPHWIVCEPGGYPLTDNYKPLGTSQKELKTWGASVRLNDVKGGPRKSHTQFPSLQKAIVRTHQRRTVTGKVATVREHQTTRGKKLPQDLSKLTRQQQKAIIDKLAKLSLKELRRRQDINASQQKSTYAQWKKASGAEKERLARGSENLQIGERLLAAAVDKQSFGKAIELRPPSRVKPKRSGTPKTDVERVMAHYNVSRKEAEKMLKKKSAKDLLPPRGTRLTKAEAVHQNDLASRADNIRERLQNKKGAEKAMELQQFPALQKAVDRITLSKSLDFNKKGSEIKSAIVNKIAQCQSELAVMVIEWKAGQRVRSSNLNDAESDEASIPSTATGTEPPEEPYKVRNKRREIEDLARVSRNVVESKTYKLSEYELKEYGF